MQPTWKTSFTVTYRIDLDILLSTLNLEIRIMTRRKSERNVVAARKR